MKKTAIFIVLFLVLAAPLFAQGNGFLNALHSNNIDTERRDSKSPVSPRDKRVRHLCFADMSATTLKQIRRT